MKISFLSILICALVLASCTKVKQNNDCDGHEMFTVVDGTELDGCGWLLEDDHGTLYEVLDLDEHYSAPYNGQEIWIKYEDVEASFSICMAGQMIDIINVCDGSSQPVMICGTNF